MSRIKVCMICGKTPVTNAFHCLCTKCNAIRLKVLKPEPTIKLIKPTKPIKKQTTKQSSFEVKLRGVKNKLRQDAIDNEKYYCQGCGRSGHLECSHTISVGMRKDLALEPENIVLKCHDCHVVWESRNIPEMKKQLCFNAERAYIYRQDAQWYHLLFDEE